MNGYTAVFVLIELDRLDDALGMIEQAVVILPKNPRIHQQAGFVRQLRKEYELALKNYDRALELDPENVHSLI
ncbi:MAG TPA: tetratricopeptide repeat protein, partial [Alphaproteobacteria bacterium]|nr:tetratricopeptide repeat protein [Alphaproteobacteria bacterium]